MQQVAVRELRRDAVADLVEGRLVEVGAAQNLGDLLLEARVRQIVVQRRRFRFVEFVLDRLRDGLHGDRLRLGRLLERCFRCASFRLRWFGGGFALSALLHDHVLLVDGASRRLRGTGGGVAARRFVAVLAGGSSC